MKIYQILSTKGWAPYEVMRTFLTEDAAKRCCRDMNDEEDRRHLASIRPYIVEKIEAIEEY